MPMQPEVARIDEGVEVDGDDGDEVVLDEATRWCWTKRRGNPGRSGARPDDPEDAAAELKEGDEELENSSVKTMCAQGAH